jgi:hypothetical protein
MMLFLLSLLNTLINYGEWVLEKGLEASNALLGVFRPKYYVIFKGSSVAYDVNAVSPFATGSRPAAWIYSPIDGAFFSWHQNLFGSLHNPLNKTHSIPVLSLEIVEKETGKVQYDLTEFIEKLQIRRSDGEVTNPSVAELVAAWTTRSQVVVDPARFVARFLDTMAETGEVEITDARPLGADAVDAATEEPVPAVAADTAEESKED